jgi:hypothetical protein
MEVAMNARMLSGWALLANALINDILLIKAVIGGATGDVCPILQLVALLLFLFGLWGIWAEQPQTGRAGAVGLVLLGVSAAIAFVVVLTSLRGGDVGDAVPFISALLGLLGRVLVGWLTVQARVFPAWVGWCLLVHGVLEFTTGVVPGGAVTTGFAWLGDVLSLAAVAGYGWLIVQHQRPKPAPMSAR